MAHAMNFTAWCVGSDEMNKTTSEAFGCENLARGRLLNCGATDTVGSVEAIEAILDKAQEAFGTDSGWAGDSTEFVEQSCVPSWRRHRQVTKLQCNKNNIYGKYPRHLQSLKKKRITRSFPAWMSRAARHNKSVS